MTENRFFKVYFKDKQNNRRLYITNARSDHGAAAVVRDMYRDSVIEEVVQYNP